MTAVELKETRQKLGLSLKDAARIFDTPERTWRAWETETGQNARRVPGFVGVGLFFYRKLRESGRNFDTPTVIMKGAAIPHTIIGPVEPLI